MVHVEQETCFTEYELHERTMLRNPTAIKISNYLHNVSSAQYKRSKFLTAKKFKT